MPEYLSLISGWAEIFVWPVSRELGCNLWYSMFVSIAPGLPCVGYECVRFLFNSAQQLHKLQYLKFPVATMSTTETIAQVSLPRTPRPEPI